LRSHIPRVDVRVVALDLGEVLGHSPPSLQEEPVGGPDHVGLVDDRDLLAAVLLRELEGRAHDPLGALLRVDSTGDRVLGAF
jgi:hypothetical protein